MEKIKILYLDDETNNLQSFKARFRNEYSIFLANNTKEAYQILDTNPEIQVILSDQRMPDMTGSSFFESLLTKHPDPIRILLTGYSDISNVIDAINRGQIFRYLEKPWNDYEMSTAIENAFKFYFVNQQLKSSNEELLKINEELNRFAYSASHDLKAPVKTMLGILELAKSEHKIDSQFLHLLNGSVKKLDYFINNIIDYYKNTKAERSNVSIDFNKIINDSLKNIEEIQSTSSQDITFGISINQDIPFANDEFRLTVIISYILSNSIKYQNKNEPCKQINISIDITPKKAKIKIGDNGIGIPEKYQENIYNMFFRGTTQSSGSGIGLYIVKEAIKKLGGTIEVHSKENKGTVFEIEIPNELN